jgi:NAD(P)-dependent dehydrogenase (short-subunit alcohol dehydrogenase family)
MELKGKVAVVTGAGGSGSGRAIAERIARDGGLVVVSDINDDGGAQTVAAIAAIGGRALYRRADVRNESEVRELVAFADRSYGGLDIMINNASGPEYRPDLPFDFWKDIVEIELPAVPGRLARVRCRQSRSAPFNHDAALSRRCRADSRELYRSALGGESRT